MSATKKENLKLKFLDGERPSGSDFGDLIDSFLGITEPNKDTSAREIQDTCDLILQKGLTLGGSSLAKAGTLAFNDGNVQVYVDGWKNLSKLHPFGTTAAYTSGYFGIGTFTDSKPPSFLLDVELVNGLGESEQVRLGSAICGHVKDGDKYHAYFAHKNKPEETDFRLRLGEDGDLHLNAADNQILALRQNNLAGLAITVNNNVVVGKDTEVTYGPNEGSTATELLQVNGSMFVKDGAVLNKGVQLGSADLAKAPAGTLNFNGEKLQLRDQLSDQVNTDSKNLDWKNLATLQRFLNENGTEIAAAAYKSGYLGIGNFIDSKAPSFLLDVELNNASGGSERVRLGSAVCGHVKDGDKYHAYFAHKNKPEDTDFRLRLGEDGDLHLNAADNQILALRQNNLAGLAITVNNNVVVGKDTEVTYGLNDGSTATELLQVDGSMFVKDGAVFNKGVQLGTADIAKAPAGTLSFTDGKLQFRVGNDDTTTTGLTNPDWRNVAILRRFLNPIDAEIAASYEGGKLGIGSFDNAPTHLLEVAGSMYVKDDAIVANGKLVVGSIGDPAPGVYHPTFRMEIELGEDNQDNSERVRFGNAACFNGKVETVEEGTRTVKRYADFVYHTAFDSTSTDSDYTDYRLRLGEDGDVHLNTSTIQPFSINQGNEPRLSISRGQIRFNPITQRPRLIPGNIIVGSDTDLVTTDNNGAEVTSNALFQVAGSMFVQDEALFAKGLKLEPAGKVAIGTISEPATYRLEVGLQAGDAAEQTNPNSERIRLGNLICCRGNEADGQADDVFLYHEKKQGLNEHALWLTKNGDLHLHVPVSKSIVLDQGEQPARLLIDSTGAVIINSNEKIPSISSAYIFQVNGSAYKNDGRDTWNVISDARLKEDVRDLEAGLEHLLRVRPIRFRYNGKAGTPVGAEGVGIIGQEIEKIFPEMVEHVPHNLHDELDGEDLRVYNGSALTYVLVNAVKELAAKLAKLEAALEPDQVKR